MARIRVERQGKVECIPNQLTPALLLHGHIPKPRRRRPLPLFPLPFLRHVERRGEGQGKGAEGHDVRVEEVPQGKLCHCVGENVRVGVCLSFLWFG